MLRQRDKELRCEVRITYSSVKGLSLTRRPRTKGQVTRIADRPLRAFGEVEIWNIIGVSWSSLLLGKLLKKLLPNLRLITSRNNFSIRRNNDRTK